MTLFTTKPVRTLYALVVLTSAITTDANSASVDLDVFAQSPEQAIIDFVGRYSKQLTGDWIWIEDVDSIRIRGRDWPKRVTVLQQYRGIPVMGGALVFSVSGGTGEVSRVTNLWKTIESTISLTPSLPLDEAISLVNERFDRPYLPEGWTSGDLSWMRPGPYFYAHARIDTSRHLVWRVLGQGFLRETRELGMFEFYMDAHTGELIKRSQNGVMHGGYGEVSPPPAPPSIRTTLNVAPNPFNPSTTIRFAVETDGPTEVSVWSVAGRQVRRLVADHLTAGVHEVSWDGTDAAGRVVGSGVYLVRLATKNETRIHRVTLLR